ncbi:ABC transport protein, ATP-binding subunit [Bathymodiolus thermophilus thioautotrophic gill symbiont]|uniref:AAA family ATPase n=1 Tax=Bathymodiolus thermophilus thioautotrophic gill symbiont TaxID=2360 RepID=UPI0010BA5CEC|nr:AAA family ATPase [Bathymodiolus thermophilus thioautotrophic gill symbiont]SGZ97532.1 ABC transport protein, ATP-binding subunit [Bathymodiolus thermophilus thioautotrophic gill symbiont]
MNNNNLSHIKIQGFKSIKELDLEMKPINVLIGANGAGKSNFISVFKLLDLIYKQKLQTYILTNGKAERFLHFGSKNTDKIIIDLKLDSANNYYVGLIKDNDSNSLLIEHDKGRFTGWSVKKDGTITRNSLESNIANDQKEVTVEYSKKYLRQCKLYHFHDTSDTAKFKSFQDINANDFLWSDAGNLAPFLLKLKRNYPKDYQNIVQSIQTVAPYFHDFDLKKDENDVILRWHHKNDLEGSGFSAQTLSDGTARFICMATLFLQPKELRPSTIVLDEPEIGLHPTAIAVLSEIIQAIANDGAQVIISTQSVELANYFEPDDFIVVNYENGESKFKRLEKKDFEGWIETYQVGEAWSEGLLGGEPKW